MNRTFVATIGRPNVTGYICSWKSFSVWRDCLLLASWIEVAHVLFLIQFLSHLFPVVSMTTVYIQHVKKPNPYIYWRSCMCNKIHSAQSVTVGSTIWGKHLSNDDGMRVLHIAIDPSLEELGDISLHDSQKPWIALWSWWFTIILELGSFGIPFKKRNYGVSRHFDASGKSKERGAIHHWRTSWKKINPQNCPIRQMETRRLEVFPGEPCQNTNEHVAPRRKGLDWWYIPQWGRKQRNRPIAIGEYVSCKYSICASLFVSNKNCRHGICIFSRHSNLFFHYFQSIHSTTHGLLTNFSKYSISLNSTKNLPHFEKTSRSRVPCWVTRTKLWCHCLCRKNFWMVSCKCWFIWRYYSWVIMDGVNFFIVFQLIASFGMVIFKWYGGKRRWKAHQKSFSQSLKKWPDRYLSVSFYYPETFGRPHTATFLCFLSQSNKQTYACLGFSSSWQRNANKHKLASGSIDRSSSRPQKAPAL